MHKLIRKSLAKLNLFTAFLTAALLIAGAGTATYVLASAVSEFSQTIGAGTLSVDFVDVNLDSVASPSVTMGGITFSFATSTSNGQLGTDSQRILASNPTETSAWSVTIAASANTDLWENAGPTKYFDFNDSSGYTDGADTDTYGGQMTINPTTGTITGVDGCTTANVTKGSSNSFVEGTTDSIEIMSADASAPVGCRWYFIGAADNVTQKIPASQSVNVYTIDLTLTIS